MEVRGNLQELVLTKLLVVRVIYNYVHLENSGYRHFRQDILLNLYIDRLSSLYRLSAQEEKSYKGQLSVHVHVIMSN